MFRGVAAGRLPAEPLLYLAGVIGLGVIAVTAVAVRSTGVLVLKLTSVVGPLAGCGHVRHAHPGRVPAPVSRSPAAFVRRSGGVNRLHPEQLVVTADDSDDLDPSLYSVIRRRRKRGNQC
ncbi:hypothetical protein P3102_19505 [Amycolatopsis sp. QT-25]|uniref:hypothetical protein n=1 Tax=Amycolatopsis sp. QT-25 TaxID=3034022 RepID=UPI0023EBFD64|nr:hypothetical protein [Amycolatopsis sp. QT-25]WET76320.1 hypothetical protein P3102_19505 [Amycolatopsis sp. QT-25]